MYLFATVYRYVCMYVYMSQVDKEQGNFIQLDYGLAAFLT